MKDETIPRVVFQDEYLLFLPSKDDGDGLWLEEVNVLLSSYSITNKETLYFQKRTYEENASDSVKVKSFVSYCCVVLLSCLIYCFN